VFSANAAGGCINIVVPLMSSIYGICFFKGRILQDLHLQDILSNSTSQEPHVISKGQELWDKGIGVNSERL